MKKGCSKCRLKKPLVDYHKSAKGKYGRRAKCKSCINSYYKDNKTKILQRAHNRYVENIEDKKKYNTQYRKDNSRKSNKLNFKNNIFT